MTDIIAIDDLADHLGSPDINNSVRALSIVDLTNGLINEHWINPPADGVIPTSVRILALAMAERAWRGGSTGPALESLTRSFDDSSRTERYIVPEGTEQGYSVFITDDEIARLNGTMGRRRVGSIRLNVPGF